MLEFFFLGRLNAYWIGLRRIRDTENFVWDDGTQLLPGSFNAWDRTEPRNAGNEDCVTMGNPCCEPNLSMYRWFDVGCTLMAFPNLVAPGFICQSSSGEYDYKLLYELKVTQQAPVFISRRFLIGRFPANHGSVFSYK